MYSWWTVDTLYLCHFSMMLKMILLLPWWVGHHCVLIYWLVQEILWELLCFPLCLILDLWLNDIGTFSAFLMNIDGLYMIKLFISLRVWYLLLLLHHQTSIKKWVLTIGISWLLLSCCAGRLMFAWWHKSTYFASTLLCCKVISQVIRCHLDLVKLLLLNAPCNLQVIQVLFIM